MTNRKPAVDGKMYDRNGFWWGVTYGKRIVHFYPRWGDARSHAFQQNLIWEKNGWGKQWGTKRFKFYMKGAEVDAYEHDWERTEKHGN